MKHVIDAIGSYFFQTFFYTMCRGYENDLKKDRLYIERGRRY